MPPRPPLAREDLIDPRRYSRLAHADLPYHNPISAERLEQVLALVSLAGEERILDVGAGKAELAIRLVERLGVRALAVELDAELASEALRRARDRVPAGALQVIPGDAGAVLRSEPPAAFGLAACVGSSAALGGHLRALGTLRELVRPGGYLLVGEPYWRRPPAPAFLAGLGITEGDLSDHAGNVVRGEELGLVPLHAITAGEADWDDYEWRLGAAIERHLAGHPDDPDAPAMRQRVRSWRRLYLEHGRETLGFGLYLFRR